MTNREYLELIVNYLNKKTNNKYKVRIMTIDINYRALGNLGVITKKEGIIGILSNDFDQDIINEEVIALPNYFEELYNNGKFIYCYGPFEGTIDLLETFDKETDYRCFIGFEKYYDSFIKEKGFSKKLKIN